MSIGYVEMRLFTELSLEITYKEHIGHKLVICEFTSMLIQIPILPNSTNLRYTSELVKRKIQVT